MDITPAAAHRPVMDRNRTGHGIATVIGCSCGASPKKGAARGSMQHVWYGRHAKANGVNEADMAPMTYAVGHGYPAEGMTWDEWYAANPGLNPFTGAAL